MTTEPFILAGGVLAGGLGVWLVLRSRQKSPAVKNETVEYDPAESVDSAAACGRTDALVLGDLHAPLITVTPIAAAATQSGTLPNSDRLALNLQPLLNRTPELLRIGQDMTTRSLRVVFSPEVTRSLQNGTLTLAQDAARELLPVATNPDTGRYVKIGRAVKTGGVRLANVAAASWQIAAIATAQHYLGEINARLQRLEDRVADIHFFQKEEKRAELRGALHLLRQYHDAIGRGELHANEITAIYQKLEDVEHTCLAIGELARELAKREMERLDALAIKELIDPRGSVTQATEWLKKSQEALELVFLAQSSRIICCHVKATLPGDRGLLLQRTAHARSEVRDATGQLLRLQQRFRDKVIEPLNPGGSFLGKLGSAFHSDHRPKAEQALANATQAATALADQIDAQASRAQQFASEFDKLANSGVALDVHINEQGKVEILSAHPA